MNPLKGEIGFEAGGQTYMLQFDFNALCLIEDRLDMGMDDILARFAPPGNDAPPRAAAPKLSFLRTLFWAGLQRHHAGSTLAQAGDLMGEVTPVVANGLILAALAKAFPDPAAAVDAEEANATGGPRKPRRPPGTGAATS